MRTTTKTALFGLLMSLLLVGLGCADAMGSAQKKKANPEDSNEEKSKEETREEFRRSIEDLNAEFNDNGEKKQDFLGLKGPCDVLKPITKSDGASATARMGWFLEFTGHANVLPRSWEGGGAIVADFYHHQMKIGYFRGNGLTLNSGVGTSASAHVGLLFGFQKNVMEYAGYFGSTEVSASLPFVKEFFEGYVGTFVKGKDVDGNGKFNPAGPDEIIEPPNGIYGGYVGIEGGVNFDPLFGAVPVEPSVSRAKHMLHKGLTKHVYNALDGRTFRLLGIDAYLKQKNGDKCPEGWPKEHKEKKCFIEFGQDGESHIKRAIKTGGAVCAVTGGCTNPVAWSAAAQSIAVGAVRDAGEDIDSYCSDRGGLF